MAPSCRSPDRPSSHTHTHMAMGLESRTLGGVSPCRRDSPASQRSPCLALHLPGLEGPPGLGLHRVHFLSPSSHYLPPGLHLSIHPLVHQSICPSVHPPTHLSPSFLPSLVIAVTTPHPRTCPPTCPTPQELAPQQRAAVRSRARPSTAAPATRPGRAVACCACSPRSGLFFNPRPPASGRSQHGGVEMETMERMNTTSQRD